MTLPHLRLQQCREWMRRALWGLLFSSGAGAFTSLAHASGSGFWSTQLYAVCIGFFILLGYDGLRRIFVQRISVLPWLRLPCLAIAIPVGFEAGSALAGRLHGDAIGFGAILRLSRLGLTITLIATISVIYFFWSQRRIAESAKARAEALQLAAETQLRLLQIQLEPHMLFNTLANLHSLIETDPERAQSMVEHLIAFMRRTLSASSHETVTLQDEFLLLDAYLELMAIRMGARLTYRLILPDELAQTRLPAMLLQPLVENAIKHGLEPKVGGGTISVEAVQGSTTIRLDVSDTGVGFAAGADLQGYGLTHVRKRLQVLYGTRAQLSIDNRLEGGVQVRIEMPR
jgi:two-component sensor histidine kinase